MSYIDIPTYTPDYLNDLVVASEIIDAYIPKMNWSRLIGIGLPAIMFISSNCGVFTDNTTPPTPCASPYFHQIGDNVCK